MPEDPIAEILTRDTRYARAAYEFVGEALRRASGHERHITPVALLESIRELGVERYGPLAASVFDQWGVRSTLDFGHVVFNCIAAEAMGASDGDRLEDFDDVYAFAGAFELDADHILIARRGDDEDEEDDAVD